MGTPDSRRKSSSMGWFPRSRTAKSWNARKTKPKLRLLRNARSRDQLTSTFKMRCLILFRVHVIMFETWPRTELWVAARDMHRVLTRMHLEGWVPILWNYDQIFKEIHMAFSIETLLMVNREKLPSTARNASWSCPSATMTRVKRIIVND